MNKIKAFILSAVLIMLFACGSQDDGSPASLKTNQFNISPFDTLVVEFDSEIVDIDRLGEANFELNQDITQIIRLDKNGKPQTKSNILYFVGALTTEGGSKYFKPANVDSIVLKGLENSDGYTTKNATLKFSTYRILEEEPNDTEEEANDLTEFLNYNISKEPFAGVLDHKRTGDENEYLVVRDRADYYKLNLKIGDIISIEASKNDTIPFKVRFYSNCKQQDKGCTDKTIDVKKSGFIQDTTKLGDFEITDNQTTERPFYIRVTDDTQSSAPYQMNIKVN